MFHNKIRCETCGGQFESVEEFVKHQPEYPKYAKDLVDDINETNWRVINVKNATDDDGDPVLSIRIRPCERHTNTFRLGEDVLGLIEKYYYNLRWQTIGSGSEVTLVLEKQ